MDENTNAEELKPETPEGGAAEALQEGADAPAVTETTEQPKEDVEVLKKRLADTQAWGHQNAQRLAEVERQLEARRLQELQSEVQPDVLGVVDKAMEAREIRKRQEEAERQQKVMTSLKEAIPDFDSLQADPEFSKYVQRHAEQVRASGREPMTDPIAAIRAVNAARGEYVQEQARKAAEQATSQARASKLSAMSVPGAGATSGTKEAKSWVDDADAVRNMSPEEFAKLTRKGLGF